MRRPEYLSPTSMSKWRQDPSGYYLKYLSDSPPPKEPQTWPMAVGSAFDAFVKSFLHEALFGKGADPAFELKAIFESQVQPQHRDKAWQAGGHLLDMYRRLGALDGLMSQLGKSVGKPRFEMDLRGELAAGRLGEVRGVPFRVKPDLFFVNEHDAHVILDWKVNGWASASGASPMKGYVKLRADGKRPESYGDKVAEHKGLTVNASKGIEAYNEEWAAQLCVGSWMCGEEVGAKFVAIVHQLVCRPGQSGLPNVRVAEHVAFVSREWQEQLHREAVAMWEAINSDHVFRFLSKAESVELCKLLDKRRDVDVDAMGAFSPALSDEENAKANQAPTTGPGDGWFTPSLE